MINEFQWRLTGLGISSTTLPSTFSTLNPDLLLLNLSGAVALPAFNFLPTTLEILKLEGPVAQDWSTKLSALAHLQCLELIAIDNLLSLTSFTSSCLQVLEITDFAPGSEFMVRVTDRQYFPNLHKLNVTSAEVDTQIAYANFWLFVSTLKNRAEDGSTTIPLTDLKLFVTGGGQHDFEQAGIMPLLLSLLCRCPQLPYLQNVHVDFSNFTTVHSTCEKSFQTLREYLHTLSSVKTNFLDLRFFVNATTFVFSHDDFPILWTIEEKNRHRSYCWQKICILISWYRANSNSSLRHCILDLCTFIFPYLLPRRTLSG
jgi:hypothetical protein